MLGIVGGMVADGSSQLFSALSLLCVWLVGVGVRSGWAPLGRREQKAGCTWEAGEVCAAAGFVAGRRRKVAWAGPRSRRQGGGLEFCGC